MRVVSLNPFTEPHVEKKEPPIVADLPNNSHKDGITDILSKIDFKNFKKDDWIIIGIIAALVIEGSQDYVLLCALGYLFFMGL